MALVELSIVEQRYRAVLEAASGVPVTEVAVRYEVSRQSVHAWIRRYAGGGLGALADRPRRPDTCPHQVSAAVEAAVCEMRREHPKWGPVRLVHELAKAGVSPVPSRMSAYRALVRHGLVEPGARKRRTDIYQRWEREAAMALWQLDIMGGAFLADGTEAKIVTGLDDHSRYCVICQVVARPTGRAAGPGVRRGAGRVRGARGGADRYSSCLAFPGWRALSRPAVRGFLVTGACPPSLLTDRSTLTRDFLPVDHGAGRGAAEDGVSC